MRARMAYVNGTFVPEAEAMISAFDTGLITGEVVVEVVRTYHQRPFCLSEHLERLCVSLDALQIDPGLSEENLADVTHDLLRRNAPTEEPDVDWQILIAISRGLDEKLGIFDAAPRTPTVITTCFPLVRRLGAMAEQYTRGVDLVFPVQRVIPPHILSPEIKSRGRLDYILGRLDAKAQNPHATGVLLNIEGQIVEGTGTNVFCVFSDRLVTPPSWQCLRGVTRGVVLELAEQIGIPAAQETILPREAAEADEIFLTSTVIGIVHGRSLQGHPIGDGTCGPVTRRIRAAFSDLVGVDIVAQAERYAERCKLPEGAAP